MKTYAFSKAMHCTSCSCFLTDVFLGDGLADDEKWTWIFLWGYLKMKVYIEI